MKFHNLKVYSKTKAILVDGLKEVVDNCDKFMKELEDDEEAFLNK